jgi:hypothetical protein
MAELATEFLQALRPEQAKRACLPLEAAELSRWYYTPTQRAGLTLAEMDAAQQRHAHRLLASGLSPAGYATAALIIGLENILDAKEGFRARAYAGRDGVSRGRDPLMYFWTIFGEPGSRAWAWRVEGHHISVRHTVIDGRLGGATPSFFGADPSDYAMMSGLLRPLGRDEDLGRELLHALDEKQRSAAVISLAPPTDVVLGNRSAFPESARPLPLRSIFSIELPEPDAARMDSFDVLVREKVGLTDERVDSLRIDATPRGLPGSEMDVPQREILRALMHQFFDRMPDEVAAREAARVEGEAFSGVHYAWAGGPDRGEPHYYRLQGPELLIEYENATAAHAHSVWRDRVSDFGADLLARHYAEAH